MNRVTLYPRSSVDSPSLQDQFEKMGISIPGTNAVAVEMSDSGLEKGQRPGLKDALSALDTGVATAMVVARLDRVGRTREELSSIERFATGHGFSLNVTEE